MPGKAAASGTQRLGGAHGEDAWDVQVWVSGFRVLGFRVLGLRGVLGQRPLSGFILLSDAGSGDEPLRLWIWGSASVIGWCNGRLHSLSRKALNLFRPWNSF